MSETPQYESAPEDFVNLQLAQVCEHIAAQGRSPNEWESLHIQLALNALASGNFVAALQYVHLALTPSSF
jgi:hypothetical protein